MGRARITENRGAGLYRAIPLYDFAALDREIARLQAAKDTLAALLEAAEKTLNDMRRSKDEADAALSEVIQQYLDGLISKLNENPPLLIPPIPNDPETGHPWVDPDRAQDGPLFDAINAARTAASVATLARKSNLDLSVRRHLKNLASSNSYVTHYDTEGTAEIRARLAGYDYDMLGVGQIQAFGPRTPADAVARWLVNTSDRTILLNPDYVDGGVAFVYAASTPYGYLWAAVFAAPGPPVTAQEITEDPAKAAGQESDAKLEKIEIPSIQSFDPQKLGQAAAAFAMAVQRVKMAEIAVSQLRLDEAERTARIAELQALKTDKEAESRDIWACYAKDDFSVGDIVYTAEVPGFPSDDISPMYVTIYEGTASEKIVFVEECRWNIIQRVVQAASEVGILTLATAMTPASVFYAAALEPGHFRWKPAWRYGTITAITSGTTGFLYDLTLESISSRSVDTREPALEIHPATLSGVEATYDCVGIFEVDDEVLIRFIDFDPSKPQVIGFRRAPKVCPPRRISWGQIM